jgi:hypothetical protein
MKGKLFILTVIAGIFMLLCSCSTADKDIKVGDKVLKGSNLVEVVNPQVYVAYLDPSVDYSKYNKIIVQPLNFDKMEIIQPSGGRFNTKFELTDEDRAKLEKIYQESMAKQLQEKGDFKIVKNPGPDVLVFSAVVLQIRPNAPKDEDTRGTGSFRNTIYSEGGGSMSIAAGLYDSESGKALAELADSKTSSSMWGVNNRVTNLADVSSMFSQWASQLNTALKKLQANKIVQE